MITLTVAEAIECASAVERLAEDCRKGGVEARMKYLQDLKIKIDAQLAEALGYRKEARRA